MATAPSNEADTHTEERAKPPFLRRVRIRGYKSIAFCDVALQPLTVLVGRNASGKSNFLGALAFLRDVVRFGVHEAVKRRGGAEAIRCRLARTAGVSLDVEVACADRPGAWGSWTARFAVLIEFPKQLPPRIAREWLYLRTADTAQMTEYVVEHGRITWGTGAAFAPPVTEWPDEDRVFLNACGGSPFVDLREGLGALEVYNFHPDILRRLHKPAPGWLLERDGGNLASVLEITTTSDAEVIERVGRYLTAITRAVELVGVVRYGEYETTRFRVLRPEGEQALEFDAAGMSDGTLRALAALVAAFQIVPPHSHPSLIAIEEPETSLHPAALRALVDALDEATACTQVVLTTQSAELLDNPTVRPENVRVVELIDGQTAIGPIDEGSLEIVRRKLDTLGGLERQNQLEPNADDLERQQRLSRSEPGTS